MVPQEGNIVHRNLKAGNHSSSVLLYTNQIPKHMDETAVFYGRFALSVSRRIWKSAMGWKDRSNILDIFVSRHPLVRFDVELRSLLVDICRNAGE